MENLKLTLSDFKSFDGETINLRTLTVLAGINSAGKSTIIQSLLILRLTIEEQKKHNLGKITIPLNGPFNLELGNTFEVIRRSKRIADSTMGICLKNESDKTLFNVTYTGDRATQTTYELTTEEYEITSSDTDLSQDSFYYLCAERIGPRLRYDYGVLPFAHVGYKGEHTFQILSGENTEIPIERTLKKESPELLLGVVRSWLDFIIPGAKFNAAVALGRSRVIEGTFAESLPTNVGFGISYVLPILVNCLIAKKDCLLIVENPEAHLHPLGQSRIGIFLAQMAASGIRIVIETHSEHVINGIRLSTLKGLIEPKKVVVNFVSKDDSERVSIHEINLSAAADLSSYPKGFFDQEQSDIAQMIVEKRKNSQL